MSEKRRACEYAFYQGAQGQEMKGPIAIPHRGGDAAGAEKENTLKAFRSAQEAGFTYIETDVIASRDGVVFTFHGTGKKRRRLQRMTADEIKQQVRIAGEAMPTVEEVLQDLPEMRFFIDPKTKQAVRPLAEVIEREKAKDRVSIGAFNYRRTKQTAQLLGGQDEVATSLGILGSVVMVGLAFRPTRQRAKAFFERTRATSLQVPYLLRSRMENMVKAAHESGVHVIVWPMNPKKNDTVTYMKRAIDNQVYGLMSDHTDQLKNTVLERNPTNASIRR